MNILDLAKEKVYTNNKGHYRLILAFYDGWNGDRRVQYEKGHYDEKGEWVRTGKAMNCKKQSFASWSKSVVEV